MPCQYSDPDGGLCQRVNVAAEPFCIFHRGPDQVPTLLDSSTYHAEFRRLFSQVVGARDGLWRGFIFPIPIRLSAQKLDFSVDARDATFKAVVFENVDLLQPVNFSNSGFYESFTANSVKFYQEAKFERTRFDNLVDLHHVVF